MYIRFSRASVRPIDERRPLPRRTIRTPLQHSGFRFDNFSAAGHNLESQTAPSRIQARAATRPPVTSRMTMRITDQASTDQFSISPGIHGIPGTSGKVCFQSITS